MGGDKSKGITKRSRSVEDEGNREAAPPKKRVRRARKKLPQKPSETLPEDYNRRFQDEWPRFLNRHPELRKRINAAVALENTKSPGTKAAQAEDDTEGLIKEAVQEAIEEISLEKRLGIIEAPLVFPDRRVIEDLIRHKELRDHVKTTAEVIYGGKDGLFNFPESDGFSKNQAPLGEGWSQPIGSGETSGRPNNHKTSMPTMYSTTRNPNENISSQTAQFGRSIYTYSSAAPESSQDGCAHGPGFPCSDCALKSSAQANNSTMPLLQSAATPSAPQIPMHTIPPNALPSVTGPSRNGQHPEDPGTDPVYPQHFT